MAEHSVYLGHCIQFEDTSTLAMKSRYMKQIMREETKNELHPNDMKRGKRVSCWGSHGSHSCKPWKNASFSKARWLTPLEYDHPTRPFSVGRFLNTCGIWLDQTIFSLLMLVAWVAKTHLSFLHSRPIYLPFCTSNNHFTLKMEAAGSSETLVSYYNTTQCNDIEDLDLSISFSVYLLSHSGWTEFYEIL
jgi:hypothetical protein